MSDSHFRAVKDHDFGLIYQACMKSETYQKSLINKCRLNANVARVFQYPDIRVGLAWNLVSSSF